MRKSGFGRVRLVVAVFLLAMFGEHLPNGGAAAGEPFALASINGESVNDGREGELQTEIYQYLVGNDDGGNVHVTITQGGTIVDTEVEYSKDGILNFNSNLMDTGSYYESFTLNGGTLTGDDRHIIENEIDTSTSLRYDGALISIVNASDRVEVSNLVLRGGAWRYDGTDAADVPENGLGLNIGLTNLPDPNDVAARTVVVRDVRADANVYDVENSFTTAASGTGINVIGASAASGVVGDVLFERVELTGNSMSLTSNGTGSPAVSPVLRGGGSRVSSAKSFTYTGGSVDGNSVFLESKKGWAAGGGLAVDGGDEFHDAFANVLLDGVEFTNNSLTRQGDSVEDSVGRGGGFFYAGYNSGGGTLDIIRSTFTDNSVTAEGTNNSALGGGASILLGNVVTTISDTTFSGNRVTSENGGGYAYGGGLSARAETLAFLQNDNSLTIAASSFEDNSAVAATTAHGGAVELSGGRSHGITDTTFSGNSAVGETEAFGGALYYAALAGSDNTVVNSTFDGNSVRSTGNASGGAVYHASGNLTIDGDGQNSYRNNEAVASGNGHAAGGAIASDSADNLGITSELFENNRAAADIASGTGSGGGVHKSDGDLSLTGNTFRNNQATGYHARGGAVDIAAGAESGTGLTGNVFSGNSAEGVLSSRGGAITYAGSDDLVITGGEFTGNSAIADPGVAGSSAYGGAIFRQGGSVHITDADITGNTVSGGTAQGSGIFIATDSDAATPGTGVALTLTATTGTMTVANGTGGGLTRSAAGTADAGIFFGSAATGASTREDSVFTVAAAANSVLVLDDNVGVVMNGGKTYTQTRDGDGLVRLGGANYVAMDDMSSARIEFTGNGGTVLSSRYSQSFSGNGDATVYIEKDHELLIGVPRDADAASALFDFTNSGTAGNDRNFVIGTEASDTARIGLTAVGDNGDFLVKSSSQDIVLVKGLEEEQILYIRDHLVGEPGSLFDGELSGLQAVRDADGNWRLEANVVHHSPFEGVFGSSPAMDALDRYVNDWSGFNESGNGADKFAAMYRNPKAIVPEAFVDQGRVMIDAVDVVASTALRQGVGPGGSAAGDGGDGAVASDEAVGMLSPFPAPGGWRVWGGYVGSFQNRKPVDGSNGYRTDRHGFVGGFTKDIGAFGSVGVYGGFTTADIRSKTINGTVDQTTGHIGVIGRLNPWPVAKPGLAVFADAGFHFSDNEMERHLGAYSAKGSFDQTVFSASFGAEYAFTWNGFRIAPAAELRYLHLDQDDMTEAGVTATRADGFSHSWLMQRIGAETSYEFAMANGVFRPSLGLAWRHDYGAKRFTTNAAFIGPDDVLFFPVTSSRNKRDSLDVTAGVQGSHMLCGYRVGFDVKYNVNVGRKATVQSVHAGVNLIF